MCVCVCTYIYIHMHMYKLVTEGKVITSLYSLSQRQSSINFQVFTSNNQHNFTKIHFKFIIV